ncbi:molybdenum cofactor guanylyltransferase MobA [Arhodomonas sp. AD133]|uniref:molybdenum cofactor guanylyltransferase MobA n=1 Tax=Arhodomonas sp. AD133 TaxID=3415009 RepID=UPI003EBD07A6
MTDAPASDVTAVILAGGRATRMGGEDKGLIPLAGRPMIEHVLAAIRPQVGEVLINANRSWSAYEAYGHPVVADDVTDFPGPLAGMAAGLATCATPLALFLPCDGPLVPRDLVGRLYGALTANGAQGAVAHDGERLQPVHALLQRELLGSLRAFLADGGRKVAQWYETFDTTEVDFSDHRELFMNVNTPDERDALAARLAAERHGP